MRLILRRVRQRQYFPVRVPASGKDLHHLFARSLRTMPRMAAVTTERKTDQPKPRLAASCGFRPSIRLTRCIGRGDEIHVPSPLPRAPIFGAPLRSGPAHVVQLRPVGVNRAFARVRNSHARQRWRSRSISEFTCPVLLRSHLGRDSTSPGFVYRRQTFVL